MSRGDSLQHWSFQRDVLENGLTVLTVEDSRVPIASVQVWYHVGSKDEDPQRQGFAHLFEHMMFRGTDRIGPQDHFKYLQRYGANVNGYTTFDTTVYFETLPASQLDLALWLEAERMGNLKINADYFAAEREVVKEERRMRYLNRPYGRLYETLFDATFKVHPYRWTPIGNMPHLDASTVEEVTAFWKTHYVPNNATLIVSGDVKHADVVAKARQFFGRIPRRPDPPRVALQEPPLTESRRVEITDIAPSPRVVLVYPVPSARELDSLAIDVLTRIMSGGQSSPLYRRLVQGKELAVNVSADNYSLEQAGLFMLSATLKPNVEVSTAEAALLEELNLILADGIDPKDIEKARNQAVASYVRSGETAQGRASQLGYAAVVLADPKRVNTDLEYTRSLTAEQVLTAARKYLQGRPHVAIVIRPQAAASAPAEATQDKSNTAEEKIADLKPPADLPIGPSPKPVDLPFPSLRKLANGLNVVVFHDPSTPAVRMFLGSRIGAKDDPADAAGTAYVMANTLRRGTKSHSGDELAQRLDFHAMSLSQSVDHDSLSVSLWTLSEHVELAGQTLAEIIREPVFPEKEVANFAARAAAQEAINEKDSSTVASRAIDRALFGDHDMARPESGTSASLKRITRDLVADYHRRFLAPDVSHLIFSGDISVDRAFELAEKHFGAWQGRAEESTSPAPPAPSTTCVLLVDRPGSVQSEIRIAQLVPLHRLDQDYAAARVAGQIFGGSFSGRLNRSLRIEKGLTYGARGYFDVKARAAAFRIGTFTRTEKTVEAVRAALDEVRRLCEPIITADELAIARDSMLGMFQMGLETPAQIADRYWDLMTWGVPESWYSQYLKAIAGIQDPSVPHQAAQRAIDPGKLTILVVGDAAKVQSELKTIAPVELFNP